MVVIEQVADKYSVVRRRLIVDSGSFDVDRCSLARVRISEMSIKNVAKDNPEKIKFALFVRRHVKLVYEIRVSFFLKFFFCQSRRFYTCNTLAIFMLEMFALSRM